MKDLRLGEVVRRPTGMVVIPEWDYIVTGIYRDASGSIRSLDLTPIPPGMKADDLGRRFPAAIREGVHSVAGITDIKAIGSIMAPASVVVEIQE